MSEPILQIGSVRFRPPAESLRELQRISRRNWAAVDVLGAHPVLQDMGPGGDTFDLSGEFFPFDGAGLDGAERLRAMQAEARPVPLIDGGGAILADVVLLEVTERWPQIGPGGVPMRQAFTAKLRSYRAPVARSINDSSVVSTGGENIEVIEFEDGGFDFRRAIETYGVAVVNAVSGEVNFSAVRSAL